MSCAKEARHGDGMAETNFTRHGNNFSTTCRDPELVILQCKRFVTSQMLLNSTIQRRKGGWYVVSIKKE